MDQVDLLVEDLIEDQYFAAGTMIATIDGEKPIEEIRVGDLVWKVTRLG